MPGRLPSRDVRARPERARLLAVPVLLGPAALAFASGGYFDTARLVAGIAAWALVALAAVALPHPLPRTRAPRIALAGLLALTVLTGASIAWAPLAGPATDDLQRLLLYLGALLAATAILQAESARRLVEPVLLAGAVAAVAYGLSERLLPSLVSLRVLPAAADRLAQPLTYWNAMGALAAMGIVLAAGLAADAGRPSRLRAAAAASAAPLGLALYLTYSRGALGAGAAGLAVLVALAPTPATLRAAATCAIAAAVPALATIALPDVRAAGGSGGQGAAMLAVLAVTMAGAAAVQARTPRPGARLPWLRRTAVAALLVALAVSVIAATRAEHHAPAPTGATAGRLVSAQSNRYEYWKVALRTFAHHPVAGAGSAAFRVEWLAHRPFRESVRDAHSLYLETLAELGLAGFAALLALLGGVAAAARRALRAEGAAAAGAVAAAATWAAHAGLDWDWEMPALTLVALVLAARLLAAAEAAAAA